MKYALIIALAAMINIDVEAQTKQRKTTTTTVRKTTNTNTRPPAKRTDTQRVQTRNADSLRAAGNISGTTNVNSNGARVGTITDRNANGIMQPRTVITTNAGASNANTIGASRNAGNINTGNTTSTQSAGTGAQTGTYQSGVTASGDVTLPRTTTPGSTIGSQSSNVVGNGSTVTSSRSVIVTGAGSGTTGTIGSAGAAVSANSNAAGTIHNNGISASSTGAGSPVSPPPAITTPPANNTTRTTATNASSINTIRTDIQINDANLPNAIINYRTKNSVIIDKITRINTQGAAERFELRLRDGRTVILNTEGSVIP